jgi:hypothetical protein
MKDLSDYSGPFNPNMRYEDLSKETLAKLLEEFAMSLQILEGNWQRILREKSKIPPTHLQFTEYPG